MAATTKLIVWNAALRELGSQPLANTTSANTRQQELNGAWDHAVEHTLALKDWGFARRRASLTGVSDTSFPPYVYRYTKPADYLRKCWLKADANNESQVDHAEIAAVFYAMTTPAVIEYVSDHADNYDPANWPPHFTRVLTLYLASLVAPKLARAGADDMGRLNGQMQTALADAESFESVFLTNVAIASDRLPVMRRAIEFMGQQLAGSVSVHSHTDMLRWHMNRAWSHAVKYCLEQGAWNFASKRAYLHDGVSGDSLIPTTDGGLVEGYSVEPEDAGTAVDVAGYDYGYPLPDDFLHKIWVKSSVTSPYEINYQIMADTLFTNHDPTFMEYVAESTFSTDPDNWPATFLEVVAAYLALLVAPELLVEAGAKGQAKINAPHLREKLEAQWVRKLSDAKMKDCIQQQTHMIPPGRFVQARLGRYSTRSLLRSS